MDREIGKDLKIKKATFTLVVFYWGAGWVGGDDHVVLRVLNGPFILLSPSLITNQHATMPRRREISHRIKNMVYFYFWSFFKLDSVY